MSKIPFVYNIEAIDVLLEENAILSRYYPLIKYKKELITKLKNNNIKTNYDCLTADTLLLECFSDPTLVNLFKRFLFMYEIDKSKLKPIDSFAISNEEKSSYKELFLLPGVKETRANLYYLSGYKSLKDIANSDVEDIIKNMNETINKYKLDCVIALPKEVKTHIAVSKAYTLYGEISR